MVTKSNQKDKSKHFDLGVEGLPSLLSGLVVGGGYVIATEVAPARYPMLIGCLAKALLNGRHVTLILSGDPETFIERVRSAGVSGVDGYVAKKQFVLFSMRENFTKNVFRLGMDYFVRELEHFGVPPGSLLLFDSADELLGLHDVSVALEQLGELDNWLRRREVTALMAFTRVGQGSPLLANLQALMDRLSGMVRLVGERDGLRLQFDYWLSPEGTIASRYFTVTSSPGQLAVVPTDGGGDTPVSSGQGRPLDASVVEDEEPHCFYMDQDLAGFAKGLGGHWRLVDTLVGMLHVSQGLRSPVLILSFARDVDLRSLAQTVHALRLGLGRLAKIVVREKDVSLRYQNESLLLRLGTNLVIHRDVPISRLPLLIESLKGQVFNRELDVSFDEALLSVMPSGHRGYLIPSRFVSAVEEMIQRSAVLDVPCAMIIGLPARDVKPLDILSGVRSPRAGDLLTCDDRVVYIFLSGCHETNVLMAVERLLGRATGSIFEEARFVISRHELEAELAGLRHQLARKDLPDFSELVALGEENSTLPESLTMRDSEGGNLPEGVVTSIGQTSEVPGLSSSLSVEESAEMGLSREFSPIGDASIEPTPEPVVYALTRSASTGEISKLEGNETDNAVIASLSLECDSVPPKSAEQAVSGNTVFDLGLPEESFSSQLKNNLEEDLPAPVASMFEVPSPTKRASRLKSHS